MTDLPNDQADQLIARLDAIVSALPDDTLIADIILFASTLDPESDPDATIADYIEHVTLLGLGEIIDDHMRPPAQVLEGPWSTDPSDGAA